MIARIEHGISKETLLQIFLTLLIMITLISFLGYFTRKAVRDAKEMKQLTPHLSFSSSSFYDDDVFPDAAFDGKTDTAWREKLLTMQTHAEHQRKLKTPDAMLAKAVVSSRNTYLQWEMGLDHSPGDPPPPRKPASLLIANGDQSSVQSYFEYSRIKKGKLILFKQPLVDVDRAVRFPDLPHFISEHEFELPDSALPQTVGLAWFPEPEASTGFPDHINLYWMRLEIISVYPGIKNPDTIAVTEIRWL